MLRCGVLHRCESGGKGCATPVLFHPSMFHPSVVPAKWCFTGRGNPFSKFIRIEGLFGFAGHRALQDIVHQDFCQGEGGLLEGVEGTLQGG
jgi:hypothetical protein